MKFGEWSDYCLPLVKSRMKANTYHNNYEIPLYLHLQPYFGEWEPREIKTSMVQQFVDIKGERYAKETIKKMTGCMSLLMDFAIDEGLADRNPVTRRIYIQSAVPPQVKRVWTQEQYDKAWAFARYRLDAAHKLLVCGVSAWEIDTLTDFLRGNKYANTIKYLLWPANEVQTKSYIKNLRHGECHGYTVSYNPDPLIKNADNTKMFQKLLQPLVNTI